MAAPLSVACLLQRAQQAAPRARTLELLGHKAPLRVVYAAVRAVLGAVHAIDIDWEKWRRNEGWLRDVAERAVDHEDGAERDDAPEADASAGASQQGLALHDARASSKCNQQAGADR
jgi:hypothetical protein